jgi:hypothetical protein
MTINTGKSINITRHNISAQEQVEMTVHSEESAQEDHPYVEGGGGKARSETVGVSCKHHKHNSSWC